MDNNMDMRMMDRIQVKGHEQEQVSKGGRGVPCKEKCLHVAQGVSRSDPK
jgi:hypothetical protein